ncbi:MAG: response regulator, partial [Candidatus Zixiibacteriota bacterium]
VASRSLRKLGYTVDYVYDGTEAIKQYRRNLDEGTPYDVVILDLTVPGGMGGKATVRELLRIDPSVRALVCSGYSNDPTMANFQSLGFCGVINKPFRPYELALAIEEALTVVPAKAEAEPTA